MKYETNITEADLHAYVDGQLDAVRHAQVEAWLKTHPDAARKVADYQLLDRSIHTLFDPVLGEPVPARLRFGAWRARISGIAASAVWLVFGVLVGWGAHAIMAKQEEPALLAHLARPAAFAHTVYTTDSRRPVEIDALEEQRLIDWLSERLRTEVRAPNLVAFGYQLVGGRLLPSTDRMAAQFMYESTNGVRITLYVRRIDGADIEPAFRFSRDRGVHTLYWIDGELGYAISGEIQRDLLLPLAEAAQRQLAI
ncbi:MAG: anti-sigma factor [Pseudomonadota bacterium]|nr:MAG: anti-sigma factor [Pseudomonadota bacterium]